MPSPRAALRHAFPIVVEAALAPLALFYLVLVLGGFRAALVAALVWSYVALARRVHRGERISTLLLLGTVLLTARTVVAFVTGSAFIYFAQPMATTVVVSALLIGSAAVGRPFTQRFAHDFCPTRPRDPPATAGAPVLRAHLGPVGFDPVGQHGHRGLAAAVLVAEGLRARAHRHHLGAHGPRHRPVDHPVHRRHAT